MEDLKIYQGNTPTIRITITSGLSDLTDYVGYFIAKKNSSDTTKSIWLASSTFDASTATFELSATDTSLNAGKYKYEYYVDSSTDIFTVGIGDLYIIDSLSK